MFDIDSAMRRYSRAVSTRWFRRGVQIDELEDHLHCEIEQLVADGLSLEAAFLEAISRLGAADALRQEFRKNKSCLSMLVAWIRPNRGAAVDNWVASPRLAMAGMLLTAVVSLVFLRPEATTSKWTLFVFDACCAVSVKLIGLFG